MKKQRDEHTGRFLPGHDGKIAWGAEVNRLRKILYTKLTNKAAGDIWDKMIDMAANGDKGAAELIMNYAGLRWKEEKDAESIAKPLQFE